MRNPAHGLPGVLGEIADLVGVGPAVAVADMVGGTRAYIARKPSSDNWLVRAVGAECAAVIADHFATGRTGVELEFPVGPSGSYNRERRQRARRMADLAAEGAGSTEIARQVGITRRSAQRFNARERADEAGDPRQGKLDF